MEITPDSYSNMACKRFVRNMIDAGLGDKLRHYQGRNFYEGPGVDVRNLQDALSATRVKCQWDNMGLGYIVYPVARCKITVESV